MVRQRCNTAWECGPTSCSYVTSCSYFIKRQRPPEHSTRFSLIDLFVLNSDLLSFFLIDLFVIYVTFPTWILIKSCSHGEPIPILEQADGDGSEQTPLRAYNTNEAMEPFLRC